MSKIQSRSEKRTRRGIEIASKRRRSLLESDKLSLPSGAGRLAIIVSRAPVFGSSRFPPKEQHRAFLLEAEAIRQERLPLHQEVVVRPSADLANMKRDFADPEVTDIILVGHGCINAMWAEEKKSFDWEVASKATAYLKQGKIEQRMCGNLPSSKFELSGGQIIEELPHKYSVPVGTFAVSKLTNVIAAAGIVVPDVNPQAKLFAPVFNADGDAVEQIAAFNECFGNVPSLTV